MIQHSIHTSLIMHSQARVVNARWAGFRPEDEGRLPHRGNDMFIGGHTRLDCNFWGFGQQANDIFRLRLPVLFIIHYLFIYFLEELIFNQIKNHTLNGSVAVVLWTANINKRITEQSSCSNNKWWHSKTTKVQRDSHPVRKDADVLLL